MSKLRCYGPSGPERYLVDLVETRRRKKDLFCRWVKIGWVWTERSKKSLRGMVAESEEVSNSWTTSIRDVLGEPSQSRIEFNLALTKVHLPRPVTLRSIIDALLGPR